MVHMIRFTAGLLILLFFVLHALNSVHAQQGGETAEGSVTRKVGFGLICKLKKGYLFTYFEVFGKLMHIFTFAGTKWKENRRT